MLWLWVFALFTFSTCFQLRLSYFVTMKQLRSQYQNGRNSAHRLKSGLPHSLPTCQRYRQRWVCFEGECLLPSPFLPVFSYVSVIFLQLITYGPNTEKAETQPTDWSLASHPHCQNANDNRQRRVCCDSEFLLCSPFLLFSLTSQVFLQLYNFGPNSRTSKTQPTDWRLASRPHCWHANDK
jgi:hypothetical protein